MYTLYLYVIISIGVDNLKYKRILIKLSGETLSGDDGKGIDFNSVLKICKEIKAWMVEIAG